MKKLLLVFCMLINLNGRSMETAIVEEFQDTPVSEDRKIASMLDAYMNGQMERLSPTCPKEVIFSDYEIPVWYHCYEIKKVNQIVYDITQITNNEPTQEEINSIDAAFLQFEKDPRALTELQAKNVQFMRLLEFLTGNDMPPTLDEQAHFFIRSERAQYQAAWGTRNIDAIEKAMVFLHLHPQEAPYRSLADKIQSHNVKKKLQKK